MSPLDRLIALAAVGLGTLMLSFAVHALAPSDGLLPGELFVPLGASLASFYASALFASSALRRRERTWLAFGYGVSALLVATSALVALDAGISSHAAGIVAIAAPIALFGLAQRAPALAFGGAFLALFVGTTAAARFFPFAETMTRPVDLVPVLPIAIAAVGL
ncbi:MAG: hypothetical protein H5U40_09040, partial [Polyangiaceae bacterium]|nr:hypothetical protein [Polyangiaceae bacterium]